MPSLRSISYLIASVSIAVALPVSASTTLVRSQPQQGGAVAKPEALELTFSKPIAPADLTITLVMTSMPGMADHKPMTIKGFDVIPAGSQVSLRFPRPLPSGTYRLAWQVRGDAAAAGSGSMAFRVR